MQKNTCYLNLQTIKTRDKFDIWTKENLRTNSKSVSPATSYAILMLIEAALLPLETC